MNWDLVVTIIIYMFCIRVAVGALWGMAKLKATFYSVNNWDWKDVFICGSAFWIGWAIGTGLRHLVKHLRKKWYGRASWKWFKKTEVAAALKKDGVELMDIEDVRE